ncbi:MAG: transglutaminase domain-containing protein [Cyanobacteria bacterium J06623_7]
MTHKGSFKLQSSSHRQDNYLSRRIVSTVLGVTLLLTAGQVYRAVISFEQQQLIPRASEIFASSKYQPIQPGDSFQLAQEDFTRIDSQARHLNYSGSSVTELAAILAQNASSDSEKARIIYAWITHHVIYDVAAFNEAISHNKYPEVTPTKVLRDRRTICSGYSNLYQALAEAMGLDAAIIIGYARGATPPDDLRFQDINHAWNSINIDGSWYLLDATFGAGSIQAGKFVANYNPHYFATPPQQFFNLHYPQDSGWQLLTTEQTRAEFDLQPKITAGFHNLGFKTVSHQQSPITTSDRLKIELEVPENIIAIADLQQNGEEIAGNRVLINRQGTKVAIDVAPPGSGTYELTIYARNKDDSPSNQYDEVIQYRVEATHATAELPKIYGHFYEHQASLIEPLAGDLLPNWSTYFNLLVPDATDVLVINTNTQESTALNGYGSYFTGNVEIEAGTTAIAAKFPGSENYWQLVEYQTDNSQL